jgi:hypothetical protein
MVDQANPASEPVVSQNANVTLPLPVMALFLQCVFDVQNKRVAQVPPGATFRVNGDSWTVRVVGTTFRVVGSLNARNRATAEAMLRNVDSKLSRMREDLESPIGINADKRERDRVRHRKDKIRKEMGYLDAQREILAGKCTATNVRYELDLNAFRDLNEMSLDLVTGSMPAHDVTVDVEAASAVEEPVEATYRKKREKADPEPYDPFFDEPPKPPSEGDASVTVDAESDAP